MTDKFVSTVTITLEEYDSLRHNQELNTNAKKIVLAAHIMKDFLVNHGSMNREQFPRIERSMREYISENLK